MIKIGDFSKLARVSIRMLRHYDDIGLLVPAKVDEFTSYRYYQVNQLTTIYKIQNLKEMGFSLALIKEILATYQNAESLKNYLQLQQKQMKQEALTMEKRLCLLENTLKRIGEESFMSQVVVTVKEIPARYVASLRKIIPSYSEESSLWQEMENETADLNLQVANPSWGLAVFHDEGYKENDVDVEIQIAVVGHYSNIQNVNFKKVEATTVASAIVKGGYENLTPANQAIALWISENNYEFDGAMFCIYHVSPGHDPNPDNWVTEVCYPVKKM